MTSNDESTAPEPTEVDGLPGASVQTAQRAPGWSPGQYQPHPGYPAGTGWAAYPHGGPQRPVLPRLPDPPVPRLLIAASLVAGLGCAAAIPVRDDGIGWPIAASIVALMVVAAAWRTPGALRALVTVPGRIETGAWAAAALLLTWVAFVRAAEWLVALCLLTACGAGALAVGGRLMGGLTRAVVSVPLAALRSVPWLGRSAARAWRAGGRGDVRLAVSVLVSIGLLAVFGALLASADAVFAGLVDAVVPELDGDTVATWVVYFVLGVLAVAGAGYLLAGPPALALPPLRTTRLRTTDWAVPVGALVVLFMVFVGVQFAALFGNEQYVQQTTGLTFAEYARSGFWQLLAVSVLALAVILAGLRWAPPYTAADRMAKRVLLTAMAVLSLVIVASALRRMWLYQEAYGFTVLRLLVGICELWLGLAFVLVAVAVLRLQRNGPVRPMVGTAVAALLVLAVLDPERFIAEQNVARFEATGSIDTRYLSQLSADAVPALMRLPDSPERSCILATIARDNAAEPSDDWRTANLSRAAARATIGDLAAPATGAGSDIGRTGEPDCTYGW